MKKQLIIILTTLSISAFAQQNYFHVEGSFTAKMPAGKVHYSYNNHGIVVKDSTQLTDGKFNFEGKLDGVQKAYFTFKPDNAPDFRSAWLDTKVIYIEAGKFKIVAQDSMTTAKTTGSKINDEFIKYKDPLNVWAKIRKPIYNEYIKFSVTDRTVNPKALELRKQLENMSTKREQLLKDYVVKNPNSYFSIESIYDLMGPYVDADKVETLWASVSERIKQSYEGKILNDILAGSRKTDVGAFAPLFAQPDTSGKLIKLENIKTKYLLIDFWASWCHPCREENPNLIKAYQNFKDKGFNVVGISLDTEKDKQKWLNAIHEDQLPWMQLISPANINSGARKTYGIRAIPSNFLIDANGKIVAKNLRGAELHEKLQVLLN